MGACICILSGFLYASLSILYKHAAMTVNSMVFTYYIFAGFIICFGFLSMTVKDQEALVLKEYLILLALSFAGLLGGFLYTRAF